MFTTKQPVLNSLCKMLNSLIENDPRIEHRPDGTVVDLETGELLKV